VNTDIWTDLVTLLTYSIPLFGVQTLQFSHQASHIPSIYKIALPADTMKNM